MGELEKQGIAVRSLVMPNPAVPDRDAWVATVKDAIKEPGQTILVGHSLGCAAILQAVAAFPPESFPRVIFVAGFGRSFMAALDTWFPSPIDFEHVRHVSRAWTVIHSTNDRLVPYKEGVWLADRLHAQIVTKENGHFRVREGAQQLPEVLDAILSTKKDA